MGCTGDLPAFPPGHQAMGDEAASQALADQHLPAGSPGLVPWEQGSLAGALLPPRAPPPLCLRAEELSIGETVGAPDARPSPEEPCPSSAATLPEASGTAASTMSALVAPDTLDAHLRRSSATHPKLVQCLLGSQARGTFGLFMQCSIPRPGRLIAQVAPPG